MAYPIKPGSKRQRIIAMLDQGPVLTTEVAAELGIPLRVASAHMSNLRTLGMVTATDHETDGVRCLRRKLWRLAG